MKELIKEMKELRQKTQKKKSIQLFLWDIIKSSDATLDAAEELKKI